MYAYAPKVRAAFILGINRCAVLQELLDALFVTLADSIVELCPAWVEERSCKLHVHTDAVAVWPNITNQL